VRREGNVIDAAGWFLQAQGEGSRGAPGAGSSAVQQASSLIAASRRKHAGDSTTSCPCGYVRLPPAHENADTDTTAFHTGSRQRRSSTFRTSCWRRHKTVVQRSRLVHAPVPLTRQTHARQPHATRRRRKRRYRAFHRLPGRRRYATPRSRDGVPPNATAVPTIYCVKVAAFIDGRACAGSRPRDSSPAVSRHLRARPRSRVQQQKQRNHHHNISPP